jgi:hypothetical protein
VDTHLYISDLDGSLLKSDAILSNGAVYQTFTTVAGAQPITINLVHQALNPNPHTLVLFLLLGVEKILIMLRHNSGFPALIRRKITLPMRVIT